MEDRVSFENQHLSNIQPSFHCRYNLRYYPATAACSNEEHHERVIFINERDAREKIASYDWLSRYSIFWNEKVMLDYRSVVRVYPSEKRIPFELVNQVLNSKSGASFLFHTIDGKHILLRNRWNCLLGQLDFLGLPEGLSPVDLENVIELGVPNQYSTSAKPIPMGDIRICVFPSENEEWVKEPLSTRSDLQEASFVAGEEFPMRINQGAIGQMNSVMRSSVLIHPRASASSGEARDWNFVPDPKHIERRLVKELAKIDPGKKREYPCKVTLKDGTVVENVVLIRKRNGLIQRIAPAFSMSFLLPHFEYYVNADDICVIEESPNALPIFVRDCPDTETSMGSLEFKVEMNDGTMHACLYGSQNPFIDLPSPYRASDIKSFNMGRGYSSQNFAYIAEPSYAICIFR